MAQLIMTHVRDDTSKPWIIVTPETTHNDTFTNEEIDILIATKTAIETFTGLVNSVIEFPDEYTCKYIMTFDTVQNAESARQMLINPPTNSLLQLRKEFMISKRIQVIGKDYVVTFSVVE